MEIKIEGGVIVGNIEEMEKPKDTKKKESNKKDK